MNIFLKALGFLFIGVIGAVYGLARFIGALVLDDKPTDDTLGSSDVDATEDVFKEMEEEDERLRALIAWDNE